MIVKGLFWAVSAFPAVLALEGTYQNKNILVHNGSGPSGVGYCVKEVRVNGTISTDETNSTAFEIDLTVYHFKAGDKVLIEIEHDKNCKPRILNPGDLFPKPSFEIVSMNLSPDGLLSWTSKNESGALPYIIEQYKWNKWVPVGEVPGTGLAKLQAYSFKVNLHSGENKFRLKQKGFSSTVKLSKDIKVISSSPSPTPMVQKDKVEFPSETAFEVYDVYGINVMKGFGRTVNTAPLKSGDYYLSYDNQTISIKR